MKKHCPKAIRKKIINAAKAHFFIRPKRSANRSGEKKINEEARILTAPQLAKSMGQGRYGAK